MIGDNWYALQEGGARLVGHVHPDLGQVIAVGLGKTQGSLEEENIDLDREAIRKAAAAGLKAATDLGESKHLGSSRLFAVYCIELDNNVVTLLHILEKIFSNLPLFFCKKLGSGISKIG